jgi:hypothetical protein
MKWEAILIFLVLLISFGAVAAPIVQQTEPAPMDLNPDNLNIVSTEHTAEYLAKTGGLAVPGSVSMNASGNWSFELRDAGAKPMASMGVQLFQAGNQVFGKGFLRPFGQNDQTITAYGTFSEGNSMALAVISLEDVSLYRLAVNGADPSNLAGSFTAYNSSGGVPLTGMLFGKREVSRSLS